ncbi:MAG TPA: type VI secretion system tip protein TssI/VgrG, partial [Polyangiaceae bacterium]|nr:type VI secretion system tip protein TssI/VgrG [Polyangiaceae bacterium]
LWLTTQRRNYRLFQRMTEVDIVLQLLSEWSIEPLLRLDRAAYKNREYRVQYGETDFTFMCRLLEDAGITFFFDDNRLILHDAPHTCDSQGELPFAAVQTPATQDTDHVTEVVSSQRVRPGRYTVRDYDFRRAPDYPLVAEEEEGKSVEAKLERYHYVPGAFVYEGADEDTPHADDRGAWRHDLEEGAKLARRRLEAQRVGARQFRFRTNAHQLAPGVVMSIGNHPHEVFGTTLIITSTSLEGEVGGECTHLVEAVSAAVPYRPLLVTPKPKTSGVDYATVVGPAGEEIHTDEFGRVRVHFHWDRESDMDESSSCWIHVSQPWAGTGFGGSNLPRIGQEVIVDFLGGNPDRPVITGRIFTKTVPTPYKLPEGKTKSGWKSMSSPGGGGFNELSMDDTKGSEVVNIQAEKDMTFLVKNNRSGSVGVNSSEIVGANLTRQVGANESVAIAANSSIDVGGSSSTSIAGSASLNVAGSSSTSVGAMSNETVAAVKSLTVGGAYQISVGAAMNETVAGLSAEQVGFVKSIVAGTTISLVCGGSSITITPGKVIIKSPVIELN